MRYVLNNVKDNSLYYQDVITQTPSVSNAKIFASRKIAENFLVKHNLTEKFSVRLMNNFNINESESDKDTIYNDIDSAISDTKDFLDTTINLIEFYRNHDSDMFNGTNIEDILNKLRKTHNYLGGIAFKPTFDNSLGVLPDQFSDSKGDTSVSDN